MTARTALLWKVLVAAALAAAAWLSAWDGPVLPQQAANEFFVVKGITAVAAVVLVAVHMADAWAPIPTLAQRLRYLFLLLTVVVIAGGSTAQFEENAAVYGRNIGGFLIAALACVAMTVSIRQDRRAPR